MNWASLPHLAPQSQLRHSPQGGVCKQAKPGAFGSETSGLQCQSMASSSPTQACLQGAEEASAVNPIKANA